MMLILLLNRPRPRGIRPCANCGKLFFKWSVTVQNSFSAILELRHLLACESPLRLGGVAPRIAESACEWICRLSQTSFNPILRVICANNIDTTWLHDEKVLALDWAPVSLAIFLTKWPGMKLQICWRTVILPRVGFRFLFFTPAEWQDSRKITSPFLFHPVGCLWNDKVIRFVVVV